MKEQAGCMHGLGMAFFRWIGKNPQKLPALCDHPDNLAEQLCIEGAIGKVKVAYGVPTTIEACKTYKDDVKKQMCEKAIKISNFGMSRDFDLYYFKPD